MSVTGVSDACQWAGARLHHHPPMRELIALTTENSGSTTTPMILSDKHYDIADGCWVWRGSKSAAGGYGEIKIGSSRIRPRKKKRVHRLAYEQFIGPIPAGMHVCHRCDNPPCINPAHLFLGTHADNMADKTSKGRAPKGRQHWRWKLRGHDAPPKPDGRKRRRYDLNSAIRVEDDGCWIWTRQVDHYGAPRRSDRGRKIGIAREVYLAHVGEIPPGMRVFRRCQNPLCVAPAHLFLDTAASALNGH